MMQIAIPIIPIIIPKIIATMPVASTPMAKHIPVPKINAPIIPTDKDVINAGFFALSSSFLS